MGKERRATTSTTKRRRNVREREKKKKKRERDREREKNMAGVGAGVGVGVGAGANAFLNNETLKVQNLLQSIKTKEMREPLEAVQSMLNQNRSLAYEILLNQRVPTIESQTHSNVLIQQYDGNLKNISQIYKQMGESVKTLCK